jgi:hypothetical protein
MKIYFGQPTDVDLKNLTKQQIDFAEGTEEDDPAPFSANTAMGMAVLEEEVAQYVSNHLSFLL